MSTHACNEICNLAGGYGHVAQKFLCDDFSDEDMRDQLLRELPARIKKDQELLELL